MNLADLKLEKQPEMVDIAINDDIFVKTIPLSKRGWFFPGHAHAYDHTSVVAHGRAAVYVSIDGKSNWHKQGEYGAGQSVTVPAQLFHLVVAMEDDTVWLCIHNTHGVDPDDHDELDSVLVAEHATGDGSADVLKEVLT